MTCGITFGIATRSRPESLRACVDSIIAAYPDAPEILIFDDAGCPPVDRPASDVRVRVFRADDPRGVADGRNRLVEEARTPYVMLLDDDARVLTRHSIEAARAVLDGDRLVAAIAFAQAEEDGAPWPAGMQPAPVSTPARIRSFIGFAHLVRRDVFRALGGYRSVLGLYGEEKEFCLRVLDAGYSVVYLPDSRVVHAADPAGRDQRRYLRAVTRNDCLNALLNEPWWRVIWLLPARAALYFRMRRAWRIRDAWGLWWIGRDLWHALETVRRDRRPVRASTIRRWRELGIQGEPYRG